MVLSGVFSGQEPGETRWCLITFGQPFTGLHKEINAPQGPSQMPHIELQLPPTPKALKMMSTYIYVEVPKYWISA